MLLRNILTAPQTRAADAYTIRTTGISSLELMEQASRAFVKAIEKKGLDRKRILVVCGVGNNGGDGLAVCRLLLQFGYDCRAMLVKYRPQLSPDCQANLDRLEFVQILEPEMALPDFNNCDLLIDALFGTGLSRPVTGFPAQVIEAMNDSGKPIFSIDLPSGLFADEISPDQGSIISADLAISFQRPKRCFFFPESAKHLKHWQEVAIGLDEEFIQKQDCKDFVLDEAITAHLNPRPRVSHKGNYGHALLIAGSKGKMGAAVLAARAALRSGLGLLTVHVPTCGYEIMQISIPEAMCSIDADVEVFTALPEIDRYQAVAIGPGLGTNDKSLDALDMLLERSKKPLVLDADALNMLAANPELFRKLPLASVLTPHIKEFDRLVGPSLNTTERLSKLRAFCRQTNCILAMKDAHTVVACPSGRLFYNTSGNPGMATGGSGDVLTGIVTALLAQGYDSLTATLLAVFYHGKAGDLAASIMGYSAMIASDLIENLRL